MHVRIKRNELYKALSWSVRFSREKNAHSAISCVNIEIYNNNLKLTTFNYDVFAEITISKVEIEKEGKVLVNSNLLLSILKNISNSVVTLKVILNKLHLKCSNSEFNLSSISYEDYPQTPNITHMTIVGKVEGQFFYKSIKQVAFSSSKDKSLPILTGIKMNILNKYIEFFATDRYRLSSSRLKFKKNNNINLEIVINSNVIEEIAKSFYENDEISIYFSKNENLLAFKNNSKQIITTLLEGDYPNIHSLFPKKTNFLYIIKKRNILDAIKKVAAVILDKSYITLNFQKKLLILSSENQKLGASALDIIDINNVEFNVNNVEFSKNNIKLIFNYKYLFEGLTNANSEILHFYLNSANKPILIRERCNEEKCNECTNQHNHTKNDYIYLLMPIKF